MIFFHDCFVIKDEGNKNLGFYHFFNNIDFLIKGKLRSTNPFCDAAVAESTVMQQYCLHKIANFSYIVQYLVTSYNLIFPRSKWKEISQKEGIIRLRNK